LLIKGSFGEASVVSRGTSNTNSSVKQRIVLLLVVLIVFRIQESY
jgi:hypothetical protein